MSMLMQLDKNKTKMQQHFKNEEKSKCSFYTWKIEIRDLYEQNRVNN